MLIKVICQDSEVVVEATMYIIRLKNSPDRDLVIYSGPHSMTVKGITLTYDDPKYALVCFGETENFENAYWYGRG